MLATFFLWCRAPQHMLRTHRSPEAYCATLWWRWFVFFVFPCNGTPVEWNWQGKTEVPGEKTCPSATLSTTNPTWTDRGSSPALRGERPATNRLSNGTAWPHLVLFKSAQLIQMANLRKPRGTMKIEMQMYSSECRDRWSSWKTLQWIGTWITVISCHQEFQSVAHICGKRMEVEWA